METHETTLKKLFYIEPQCSVRSLKHKACLCASNGSTDNYTPGSVWDEEDID